MRGLEENNLCVHGGDMLAYLYNEMPSAHREVFELHLADCGTCIDDFAELSQSRYPVYEWKLTEFDPLPTPTIAIPYSETAVASWLDRLRATFAIRPSYAFGGVAAMLLVGAVTTYVLLSGPSGDVAQRVQPSPSPSRSVVNTSSPVGSDQRDATAIGEPKSPGKPEIIKATVPAKREPRSVRNKPTIPGPKRNESIPVYSAVEDDEDDSLRLSDIFAEIDTSE